MKGFNERNPVVIAVTGLVVLVAIAVTVFYANDLPVIGGGSQYAADFTDASGLKSGDDVRIAGVKIGSVDSIVLSGSHVRVNFRAKNAWIGDQSNAAIKIKTLLGQEYVELEPLGDKRLDSGSTIPLSRTTTPLDVNAALSGLSRRVGSIDTTQLAKSFSTLANTFRDTPRGVKYALRGLTSLSRTIASRDDKIRELAGNANQLSGTVADSNEQFSRLINAGALLLQELQSRSAAVTRLLQNTQEFGAQLSGLVRDNNRTLAPALQQLTKVTTILKTNQGNLGNALHLIGPYYRLLDDATGSGSWVDVYICGLFNPQQSPVLDANALRNCSPKRGS